MSLTIVVGRDGRPSMGGTFNKLENDSTVLAVRRRLRSRRSGNIIKDFWRVYNKDNPFLERGRGYVKTALGSLNLNTGAILRWGNSMSIDTGNSIVYNSAAAVSKASNKKETRIILNRKGVAVPKIIDDSIAMGDLTYPIIARPSHHAKGRNFVVLNNQDEFVSHFRVNSPRGWYYSEYINKVKEYRVHCAHGRILNFLEKPNPNNGSLAWNRAGNGSVFTNVNWDSYDGRVALECLKAVKALGLDFAGVDVMIDSEGNPYILELNTGPTLNSSEYSMTRYAKYFDWLAKDTSSKRPHWDIPEEGFRRPKNYAWHNFHFEDREPNNNRD